MYDVLAIIVIVLFQFSAHKCLISNDVFWIQLMRFKVFLKMRDRQGISSILYNICSGQRSCTILNQKDLKFGSSVDGNVSMINETKFSKNFTPVS